MSPVRGPMRDLAVSIPHDARVRISSIDTRGQVDSWSFMECRISLTTDPFRAQVDPLLAETLPHSLAYVLAVVVATPIEVPVRVATVDWAISRIDVNVDASWGAGGLVEVDLEFTAQMRLPRHPARLINYAGAGGDFVAPSWFCDTFRDFLRPMFSTEGWDLTSVSSA